MKLLKYPDPFLFKKVQEVTEFNDELQKMLKKCYL